MLVMLLRVTAMTQHRSSSWALLVALSAACGGESPDVIDRPGAGTLPPDDSEEPEEPAMVPEEEPSDEDDDPPLDPLPEPLPEPPADASRPGADAPLGDLQLCVELAKAPCPEDDDSELTPHGGPRPWAPCRFELADQGIWATQAARIDALAAGLPEVGIAGVLGDLDRLATPADAGVSHLAKLQHLAAAFRWQDVDFHDAAWMPQGLSGSADATAEGTVAGRKVVAASWYYKASVGGMPERDSIARISFADVSALEGGGAVPYRHVLLVEPTEAGGVVDFKATRLHAGGIAWVGDYLYVADTAKGLRVFDTSRILEVSTAKDRLGYDAQTGDYHAYGYKYVLPQVGAYFWSDQSCWARTSFVGLDATSEPPSLVTGEFHDLDYAGKLVRWPLAGQTLLATDPERGVTASSEVVFAQESDMQGAVSVGGEWWISSSAQSGADGRLYRARPGRGSYSFGWVVGPEDVMWERQAGHLWSQNEFAGKRFVFSVAAKHYAKP